MSHYHLDQEPKINLFLYQPTFTSARANIFGLAPSVARACLTNNVRSCILHAQSRKFVHKSAVSMGPLADLAESEVWKVGQNTTDGFAGGADFVGFDDSGDDMEVDKE